MRIWRWSAEKHKLRYTEMVADWDSKTNLRLCQAKPCAIFWSMNAWAVSKKEVTALKKSNPMDSRGNVVRVGGQGSITEKVMKGFQRYYGKVIRYNKDDPVGWRKQYKSIFCLLIDTLNITCAQSEQHPGANTIVQETITSKTHHSCFHCTLCKEGVCRSCLDAEVCPRSITEPDTQKMDSSTVVKIAVILAIITFN